jgi:hypothetical protein
VRPRGPHSAHAAARIVLGDLGRSLAAAALARVPVVAAKLVRHSPELALRLTLAGDAAKQVMQWTILHGRCLPARPAREPARLVAANAG